VVRLALVPAPGEGCRCTPANNASRVVPSHSGRAGVNAQRGLQRASRYARRARLDAARMAGAPPGGRVERERLGPGDRRCAGFQARTPAPVSWRGGQRRARRDQRRACLLHRHRGLGQLTRRCPPCRSVSARRRRIAVVRSEISKPRPGPPTVCCWTISCRDGADRFVAPRTLATCSPQQPAGHPRSMLRWQRRATMGQRCERRRRRAIGRSRSASPSCVDASLMGPC